MKIFVLLLTVTMVVAKSSHSSSSPLKENQNDKDNIAHNLKKLKELLMDKVKSSRTNSVSEDPVKDEFGPEIERKPKSLNYYPFYPSPQMVNLNYPSPGLGFYPQSKDYRPIIPEEWLSRTEPFKRKTNHIVDSPTYYIRLPPNPYVFVPGVGYISRPPTMTDPEVLDNVQPGNSEKPSSPEILPDQFYHVPINFVSNGKPTSVFQLQNEHIVRPKPEASIITLNKGPYLFNGKPTDIYLLRNSFNSLYADALTNFYP